MYLYKLYVPFPKHLLAITLVYCIVGISRTVELLEGRKESLQKGSRRGYTTHYKAKAVLQVDVSDVTNAAEKALHVLFFCLIGQPPNVNPTRTHDFEAVLATTSCFLTVPSWILTRSRLYSITHAHLLGMPFRFHAQPGVTRGICTKTTEQRAMSLSRIYVGRLSYQVREKDVERFFRGFGRIRDINLKNGFGFVVRWFTGRLDTA